MPDDSRATAIACLGQLRDCLRHSADDLSVLADQTEHLISAVHASHMEAIRFRLFGLHRQFASRARLPEEAPRLLEVARASLQQAGFRI